MKKRNYEKEFDLVNTHQSVRMQNANTMIDLFSVNLFFFEQYNTLILPGGILYDPIFNTQNPAYMNYATVGVYLSHEIWHFIEKGQSLNCCPFPD
jgi:predicted metalloendopeptidase